MMGVLFKKFNNLCPLGSSYLKLVDGGGPPVESQGQDGGAELSEVLSGGGGGEDGRQQGGHLVGEEEGENKEH